MTSAEQAKADAMKSVNSIFASLGMMACVIALSFYESFVLLKIWKWFLVPIGFPNIAYPSFWAAVTVWSILNAKNRKAPEPGDVRARLIGDAFALTFVLLLAFTLRALVN